MKVERRTGQVLVMVVCVVLTLLHHHTHASKLPQHAHGLHHRPQQQKQHSPLVIFEQQQQQDEEEEDPALPIVLTQPGAHRSSSTSITVHDPKPENQPPLSYDSEEQNPPPLYHDPEVQNPPPLFHDPQANNPPFHDPEVQDPPFHDPQADNPPFRDSHHQGNQGTPLDAETNPIVHSRHMDTNTPFLVSMDDDPNPPFHDTQEHPNPPFHDTQYPNPPFHDPQTEDSNPLSQSETNPLLPPPPPPSHFYDPKVDLLPPFYAHLPPYFVQHDPSTTTTFDHHHGPLEDDPPLYDHQPAFKVFYQSGKTEKDLPVCSPWSVCNKVDTYDAPRIERQCRCPSEGVELAEEEGGRLHKAAGTTSTTTTTTTTGCSNTLDHNDGHTITDKTRQFKTCEPVRKLPRCRYFRDVTWTFITYPDNVTQQVMHCVCPRHAVAYIIKRQAYHSPRGLGFQYSFACSPQSKLRCQRKEPCRLFTVKKRPQFEDVNTNTLCQCPHSHTCPAHHTDPGVIPGKTYTEDSIRTYSGYCM